MKYKTILFDLDDTIFDHQYARRCAFLELNKHYNISGISLQEMEKVHQYYLDLLFHKVLEKRLSLDDSRKQRMMLFFRHFGYTLKEHDALEADSIYRNEYNNNRQSIPGVNRLIEELKKYARIGIITNGLRIEQDEKIKICKIEDSIDYLIISEEIGCNKPAKEFFIKTLEKTGNNNDECIVIGDSWESDILGSYNTGIKSIWINRYETKCPDPGITTEIHSYDNLKELLTLFF